MSRVVSYEQQTLNSPNPFTRLAHRSRYKVSLELTARLLPPGGRVVDFGAGQGTFLAKLREVRPDVRLTAIEPFMRIDYPFIERITAIEDLEPNPASLVTAFETLEHVSDDQLNRFLKGAARAIGGNGRVLVTVPIMYGATLPVKEVSRMLLHRRASDIPVGELLRATFGRPIPRTPDRNSSHKGFDFRWLDSELARELEITERSYSPFPALPWWLNSQAILIGRNKPR